MFRVYWNAESILGVVGITIGLVSIIKVSKSKINYMVNKLTELEAELKLLTNPKEIKKLENKIDKLDAEITLFLFIFYYPILFVEFIHSYLDLFINKCFK